MKRFVISLAMLVVIFFALPFPVSAQIPKDPQATLSSSLATESAEATDSAVVTEQIQQKLEKDITQPAGKAKSRLAEYLDQNPAGPPAFTNIVQLAIRRAVDRGVPANLLVLLLLFPVIASLIAIFRHVIGLRGFGVYTPAVLAVAFVSTGISTGLLVFSVIFLTATLGKSIMTRFKLQYLPRTAVLLWMVSLVLFGLLLVSPYILDTIMANIVAIGIFPILVLVLLSENFLEAQLTASFVSALQLTVETLVLAVVSALVMRTFPVQQFVILHPEFTILSVLIVDVLVGKYTGLRISEYFRFKPIIDPEE